MTTDRAQRRAIDERFLGLEAAGEDGRTSFVVAAHLARFDRRLYGGAAIAVSLAAMERATGRDAMWATTQFASTAPLGARVDVDTEVVAAGRRTSQVRITATSDGELVFAALGAAGEPRPDGITGTLERMPSVAPPGTGRLAFGATGVPGEIGWHAVAEARVPEILDHPDSAAGRLCLWVRLIDGEPVTAARLAFVADLVPLSVARGCDVVGVGTSLDNTLRVGAVVDTEWVLVDLRPHLAHGGFGHGTVHLWSEGGALLATGSQTASMYRLEHDPLETFPTG
jgi:acyl-CoA thioesterase